MKAIGEWVLICGMAAAGVLGTYWVKGPPRRTLVCDPSNLKADEICLQQLAPDAKILWIDARPRKEWLRNGVAGSVLWNLDPAEDLLAFEAETAMRIMETPRVIVYCGDENCGVSRQVAERVRGLQLGAQVSVLHGGWRALNEAGLAVSR